MNSMPVRRTAAPISASRPRSARETPEVITTPAVSGDTAFIVATNGSIPLSNDKIETFGADATLAAIRPP